MVPQLGKLKLGDFSLDLDKYIKRDYEDISLASSELPSIMEWVSGNLQSLSEQKLLKNNEVKVSEAKAYFDLKNGGFIERGYQGRMTEEAIRHAVNLDEKVQKAVRELAILTAWVARLHNLQDTLQMKLDLIRSTEATKRKIFSNEERD